LSEKRKLLWVRVIFGAFLVWLSWDIMGTMQETAHVYGETGNWASWPVIGAMRPLELAFWTYIVLFGFGIFLMGGLLVRVISIVTFVLAVSSFAIFGLNGWLTHGLVLVGAIIIMARGGGAGTMDAALGAMQRRSLEREAEREAVLFIPLVGYRSVPWDLSTIPAARRGGAWRAGVITLLLIGLLVVLVLWACFLLDYGTTRYVYFVVALLHVLADVPFLLRML
jgi:hypothetical protein